MPTFLIQELTMKPIRILAPALLLILFFGLNHALAADSPWDMKLPFEHATISYEITGMESGTETLYIKDYGKYRAVHHDGTTSMLGFTSKARRLEITDPDWHYMFDLEEKTGTKTTNPTKLFNEEYKKLTAAEQENVRKNSEELGISMIKDFQGQTIEKAATILGYECDRTTVMGITVNVIHKTDVPLLTEMNLMGMKAKILATAIDTSAPPAAEAFALPADITAVLDQAAEDGARQMTANFISTLKEPDGAEKMKAQMASASPQQPGTQPQGQGAEPVTEQPAGDQLKEEGMEEGVQQSIELLKGLFGN